MEEFKPKRNLLQLARTARLYAMAKVDAHDRTMGDFKTAHPDDYVKHPTLKKESYKLRDAYYDAKEKVLDLFKFEELESKRARRNTVH